MMRVVGSLLTVVGVVSAFGTPIPAAVLDRHRRCQPRSAARAPGTLACAASDEAVCGAQTRPSLAMTRAPQWRSTTCCCASPVLLLWTM